MHAEWLITGTVYIGIGVASLLKAIRHLYLCWSIFVPIWPFLSNLLSRSLNKYKHTNGESLVGFKVGYWLSIPKGRSEGERFYRNDESDPIEFCTKNVTRSFISKKIIAKLPTQKFLQERHINDCLNSLSCDTVMFANDVKSWRTIESPSDVQSMNC